MIKRKALFSLALGATLFSAPAMAKINFVEYTLPNGLHVILHEDHSTPIVAVSVMYHVGSKNEDPQRTGFAHFFEHLLFEGSENIKRGEFMKLIETNGGDFNANTSQDRTFYFESFPSNKLELGLWLESERMLHAKIDNEGVETQRKVVKEEKKQRYDNTPYGQLINVVYENAFQKSSYRWSPIGKDQYIDNATLPEFMAFYKKWYVPDNAVLVIGGDIDIETTKGLVAKYFGDIPKGAKPIDRTLPIEPPHTAEKRVTFYDNVQLPAVVIAYNTPKMGSADSYAIEVLNNILSKGKSSRLQKNIVDKQQKAIYSGAFSLGNEDPGVSIMFAITNQGVTPEQLEQSILAEVQKVQTTGVTDAEYKKVMNQIESDFVQQNQKVMGVVENLATNYTYFGDANLINTEIEKFNKVTKDDLKRVANKYFTKNNRLVVYYLPKSQQKG